MLFNGGKVSLKETENETQEGCPKCRGMLACQRLFLSKPGGWELGSPLPSHQQRRAVGQDGHLAAGELRPRETIVCCWVPVGNWCVTLGPRRVKVSMSCAPSLPRESSHHSPFLFPGYLAMWPTALGKAS